MDKLVKLFFLFMALYIGYGYIKRDLDEKELLKNFKITTGYMHRFTRVGYPTSGKNSGPFRYKYEVGDLQLKGSIAKSKFCKEWGLSSRMEIAKVHYPVAYHPDSPKNSKMLLKKEDYELFGLKVPDSLQCMVLKYFDCNEYNERKYAELIAQYCPK